MSHRSLRLMKTGTIVHILTRWNRTPQAYRLHWRIQ
jgi:hypothetical protein